MEIRSYDDSDLETCRELWVQLTERHREIYEDPSIGGDDVGLQFDRLWLAEAGGKAVGMVALMPRAKERRSPIDGFGCRPRGPLEPVPGDGSNDQ